MLMGQPALSAHFAATAHTFALSPRSRVGAVLFAFLLTVLATWGLYTPDSAAVTTIGIGPSDAVVSIVDNDGDTNNMLVSAVLAAGAPAPTLIFADTTAELRTTLPECML